MSYACLKRDKIIGVSLKGSMEQVDEFLCDEEDRKSDREKTYNARLIIVT